MELYFVCIKRAVQHDPYHTEPSIDLIEPHLAYVKRTMHSDFKYSKPPIAVTVKRLQEM